MQGVPVSGVVVIAAFFMIRGAYATYTTWERQHPESAEEMKTAVAWIVAGVVLGGIGIVVVGFVYDTRDAAGWQVFGILAGVLGVVATVHGFGKKNEVTGAPPAAPAASTTLVFVGKVVVGRPGNQALSGTWSVTHIDSGEVVLTSATGATYRMSPAMFTAALSDGTLTSM